MNVGVSKGGASAPRHFVGAFRCQNNANSEYSVLTHTLPTLTHPQDTPSGLTLENTTGWELILRQSKVVLSMVLREGLIRD
jgi:hypothetical protein